MVILTSDFIAPPPPPPPPPNPACFYTNRYRRHKIDWSNILKVLSYQKKCTVTTSTEYKSKGIEVHGSDFIHVRVNHQNHGYVRVHYHWTTDMWLYRTQLRVTATLRTQSLAFWAKTKWLCFVKLVSCPSINGSLSIPFPRWRQLIILLNLPNNTVMPTSLNVAHVLFVSSFSVQNLDF